MNDKQSEMRSVVASIAALLFSIALLQTGNGLQGTLLPVRAGIEAFSTLSIGLLGSTYYIGFAAGCLLGPYLVRQVGHIRVFTAMAALASAAPLAHGLLLTPAPWWVLRALTGFCFAVLFMVIESWLNERATQQTRGSVLAIYLVINLTVMTVGQMMLTLFDAHEFVLFAIVSILVSIAAVPVSLSAAPAPAPIERVKINLLRVYRISPVGFVGCFAIGIANGAFWSLAPTFAGAGGLDVSGVAVFMSTTVIAGAVAQWPVGMISDRLDRRKVLLTVAALAAVVGALLWWHREAAGTWLLVMTACWGFTAFPLYGVAIAHANDYASPDQFVEVSGALLLVFAAGAVIGPMLASALMAIFHASYLFAFTGITHLLFGLFVAWRMRRRAPAPAAEHVRFIDALEASQTVSSTFDSKLQEALVEESERKGQEKN